jgi:peroxiredoxin
MTRAPLALAFSLVVACGGAGIEAPGAVDPAASTTKGGARTGADAADFAARDVDGKTVKLSDYLGRQAILLDFWATWCEPCLAELPHLRALYDKYRARGVVVLAVSMDGPETVADVPSYAKRNGMNFPVLLDEDSRIASIYNPKKSAPFNVLIDRSGKIVHVHEGYNPGDEALLADAVAKALDDARRGRTP